MYKPWQQLLQKECRVIEVNNNYVFPIFKNGTASLDPGHRTRKRYINNDIKELENIIVFLRNPEERFTSGVNTVAEEKDVSTQSIFEQIQKENFADWHFVPQFVWLCHLSKYYKGNVDFRSMDNLKEFTELYSVNYFREDNVSIIPKFVDIDNLLLSKYLNHKIALADVIKELYHDLPNN
jgi:hypothetical protein